jgi:hypothetical protein
MAQQNSPLVIFGNPKGKEISESNAWTFVIEQARAHGLVELENLARLMLGQVRGGHHANPRNMSRPTIMSHHVQAIAYVHEQDGGQYVHGFGNVELSESDLKKGILNLSELAMKTHVDMIGYPDGTITLIGTKGQPLSALFPE